MKECSTNDRETALPILVFHRGKQKYVKSVLEQAEKYHSKVILIGNDENKNFSANWINYKELDHMLLDRFKDVYIHMSSNPYQIEMFCLESWFYYYECAKKMGLQEFITMDSDVLLYRTIRKSDFGTADVALGWAKKQEPYIWAYNPYFAYWKISKLENYLLFCIETYSENNENTAKLREKWQYHKTSGKAGGVCDMTLMYLWAQNEKNLINVLDREWGGGVFDRAIKSETNYEKIFKYDKVNQMKKIEFDDNHMPYFVEESTEIRYPVVALHCISNTKIYINLLKKGVYNQCLFVIVKYINWFMGKVKQVVYYLHKGSLLDRLFRGKKMGRLEETD